MIAATPASSKRCARSSAESCDVSAQPWVATLPSRASRPTATRFGNTRAAALTKAGSRTAAVPMITRSTPLPSQPSTVAMSRMPPPSCTHRPTVSRMRSTAAAFIGLPAKAPSRSTTCRWRKPSASKVCACAAGSRLNTVARAMSPCWSRTHTPSLRSIAGKRIIVRLRRPLEEIGDEREAEALALLGVELGAEHGVARDDRGDGAAVVGLRDEVGAVGDLELIGMHEVGVQAAGAGGDAVEQRMMAQLVERVPAHVRDFQARVVRRDAVDLAGDPAEAGRHLVFAPALGHQLHADADAEERPAFLPHRDVERVDHAGDRIEPAPAVREGADTGQHHAIGA